MSILRIYSGHKRRRYPQARSGHPSLKKLQGKPIAKRRKLGNLADVKVWRDPVKYGYAVGRIKVREIDLLNRQRLGRLIEADFAEALRILEELDYGQYLKGASVAADVDAGLMQFLRDLYEFLTEITPKGSYIKDWLLARYDFHNLKVLLKEGCCDGRAEGITLDLGTRSPDAMRAALQTPLLLPPHLRDAVFEVLALFPPTSQAIDTILDRRLLEYRLELARLERSSFMERFTEYSIDIANLKTLFRAQNLGKEAGFLETALAAGGDLDKAKLLSLAGMPAADILKKLEASRYASKLLRFVETSDEQVGLTEYDRRADDLLMQELHKARHLAVGVEPILGYVRGRENDVTLLRVILMGKLHNLTPQAIEEHMRVLYGDMERP